MSASRIHLSAAVVAGLILATAAGVSVNIIATSAATAQELQPMSLHFGNVVSVSNLTAGDSIEVYIEGLDTQVQQVRATE